MRKSERRSDGDGSATSAASDGDDNRRLMVCATVNGDGLADIIVGMGIGGGPEVRVFNGDNLSLIRDFLAYDPLALPLVPVFGDIS